MEQVIQNKWPKCLMLIVMIYIMIDMASYVLTYKLVEIGYIFESAATFTVVFTSLIEDITSEVYGYSVARQLIWYCFLCEFLFVSIIELFIHLPSPEFWNYKAAYAAIISPYMKLFIGNVVADLFGSFSNIYVISKWKILVKGKYFWLRSVCSTSVGLFISASIAIATAFFHVIPNKQLFLLIGWNLLFKLLFAAISAIPGVFLVKAIKKIENIDVYDYATNFNPLQL